MRKALAILLLARLASGCGDDEHLPGAPDGGSGPDGPRPGGGCADAGTGGGGDGGLIDEYDQPSDFDRIGCAPGSLTGADLAGIWHQDVHYDVAGDGVYVQRWDRAGAGFTVRFNGNEAGDVRVCPDDIFVRRAVTTDEGKVRVRTFDACRQEADGSLWGKVAVCATEWDGCFTGTFESVKLRRIPGEADAQGVSLLGEWAGDAAAPWGDGLTVNVRVKDGVAYLARYQDGLRIVDVADPAAMRDLGWVPTTYPDAGEIYNDVKVVDGPGGRTYALVASDARGVVAYDVTDPAAPAEVSAFPAPPMGEPYVGVHTLFTETRGAETRAYLANTTTVALDVYDVTDPRSPVALGSYRDPEVDGDPGAYLHDLYVENGRAYLNYWSLGLVVVDTLPDPANITRVGQYKDYERRTNHSNWVTTAGGRRVSVMGDEDFGAHVRLVDVDPASPAYMTRIGEFSLRPEVSVHNIMAFGDRAYIAYYQDGLRVLDLSDPTAPALAGWYNTWDGRVGASFYEAACGIDVDLARRRLFVADTARGLLILSDDLP